MSEESHTGHFFTARKEAIMKQSERVGSRKAERKRGSKAGMGAVYCK